jgi:acyl carrier protein
VLEIVTQLLQATLGKEIGTDSDFFDEGANSIAATRFVARVETELGYIIPTTAIFEKRTPRAIAEYLESQIAQRNSASQHLDVQATEDFDTGVI